MSQKNVCMEINTDKFKILEDDKAIQIDGGVEATPRDVCSAIFDTVYKVIDFIRGK